MADMADMGNLPSSFGLWLAQHRKTCGYTQGQLAGEVGYSVFTIERIEEGTRRPSRKLAQLLVESLGVPEEERSRIVQLARERPYGMLHGSRHKGRVDKLTRDDRKSEDAEGQAYIEAGRTASLGLGTVNDLGVAVILVAIPSHSNSIAQQVASAIVDALRNEESGDKR